MLQKWVPLTEWGQLPRTARLEISDQTVRHI